MNKRIIFLPFLVALAACATTEPSPTTPAEAPVAEAPIEIQPTETAGPEPATQFPPTETQVPDATNTEEADSGVEPENEVTVSVVDTTFLLNVIEVPVGTTVTWVYEADLPHTVTSDTNLFNSGTLSAGDRFSFTFNEAGTFPYFCRFHGGQGGSGMSGVINVVEG